MITTPLDGYKKIIVTSEIIEKYGGAAALVLAERSLKIPEVKSLLETNNKFSDELVQEVIQASRRRVRRERTRQYRPLGILSHESLLCAST